MCLVPQFMWRGTVQGTDGGRVSIVIILQAIYCSIKRVSTVSGTLKKIEHTKNVIKISNNSHNYCCCMEKHSIKQTAIIVVIIKYKPYDTSVASSVAPHCSVLSLLLHQESVASCASSDQPPSADGDI